MQGSAEWLKDKPRFLSQVYCIIKKKNIRGETCSRAFKALYYSEETEDIEIPEALRVIPYRKDGDVMESYPTEVIFSYKCIARMPLLDIAADVETTEEGFDHDYCMETDEEEVEGAHAEEQEGAEGESVDRDYEAEEILDCIVHSDESVEYLVEFKRYMYAEAEWIATKNTIGCKTLMRH